MVYDGHLRACAHVVHDGHIRACTHMVYNGHIRACRAMTEAWRASSLWRPRYLRAPHGMEPANTSSTAVPLPPATEPNSLRREMASCDSSLVKSKDKRTDAPPLLIVMDNQGCMTALEKGPLRQKWACTHEIWDLLQSITSFRWRALPVCL